MRAPLVRVLNVGCIGVGRRDVSLTLNSKALSLAGREESVGDVGCEWMLSSEEESMSMSMSISSSGVGWRYGEGEYLVSMSEGRRGGVREGLW
jgi:hypothetical protein